METINDDDNDENDKKIMPMYNYEFMYFSFLFWPLYVAGHRGVLESLRLQYIPLLIGPH